MIYAGVVNRCPSPKHVVKELDRLTSGGTALE